MSYNKSYIFIYKWKNEKVRVIFVSLNVLWSYESEQTF